MVLEDASGTFIVKIRNGCGSTPAVANLLPATRRARRPSMLLDAALDRLADNAQTPKAKLLAALDLYDEGVAI